MGSSSKKGFVDTALVIAGALFIALGLFNKITTKKEKPRILPVEEGCYPNGSYKRECLGERQSCPEDAGVAKIYQCENGRWVYKYPECRTECRVSSPTTAQQPPTQPPPTQPPPSSLVCNSQNVNKTKCSDQNNLATCINYNGTYTWYGKYCQYGCETQNGVSWCRSGAPTSTPTPRPISSASPIPTNPPLATPTSSCYFKNSNECNSACHTTCSFSSAGCYICPPPPPTNTLIPTATPRPPTATPKPPTPTSSCQYQTLNSCNYACGQTCTLRDGCYHCPPSLPTITPPTTNKYSCSS